MTYLQLVNAVLRRLRENTVSTVSESAYSTLIGKFVNDAKRQVEDAWNWESLYTTLTVTTSSGTSGYTLTGSGRRFKINSVNDSTSKNIITPVPLRFIIDSQQTYTLSNQQPNNYAISGSDGTDATVEFYPTPDGTYSIKFNCYVPQVALSSDSDVLTIPSEPVEFAAYARAIVERGEDGGLSSSEAYGLYKGSLADHIALETVRNPDFDCMVAV